MPRSIQKLAGDLQVARADGSKKTGGVCFDLQLVAVAQIDQDREAVSKPNRKTRVNSHL